MSAKRRQHPTRLRRFIRSGLMDACLLVFGVAFGIVAYIFGSVAFTWAAIVCIAAGITGLRRRLPAAGNSETEHQVYKPW